MEAGHGQLGESWMFVPASSSAADAHENENTASDMDGSFVVARPKPNDSFQLDQSFILTSGHTPHSRCELGK